MCEEVSNVCPDITRCLLFFQYYSFTQAKKKKNYANQLNTLAITGTGYTHVQCMVQPFLMITRRIRCP